MKPDTAAMAAMDSGSGSALAGAPALTPEEIDRAKRFLQQTHDELVAATRGLSEAQWKFKPAADRWSIAEIVEHVATVHSVVVGPVSQRLAEAPAPPRERDYRRADSLVIEGFPNRTARFKGPDALQPAGRVTPAESLEALAQGNAELLRRLENAPDLRGHAIDSAPMKAISNGEYETMDGYQWILAAAGHAARHTGQILEVKAEPGFPPK